MWKPDAIVYPNTLSIWYSLSRGAYLVAHVVSHQVRPPGSPWLGPLAPLGFRFLTFEPTCYLAS